MVQESPAEKFSRVTNITTNQLELGGIIFFNKKDNELKTSFFYLIMELQLLLGYFILLA